ncbi:MAG: WG repeat-containing protein [Leptolyngbya sp.]|nr:WG repeat-containing protein [Candidatus Melainabacteria bacterium]
MTILQTYLIKNSMPLWFSISIIRVSAIVIVCATALIVGGCTDSKTTAGTYGYIDHKGNFVIKPQFLDAHAFVNGVAKVETDLSPYHTVEKYIDKSGSFISAPPNSHAYDRILPTLSMADDPSTYEISGEDSLGVAFVNNRGLKMMPFSEGLAIAKRGGNSGWGYVDSNLEFVIPANSFLDARHFKDGLAAVAADVDDEGRMVSVVHGAIEPAHKKWGYVNRKGDWVIKPEYSSAECFSEGLACVSSTESIGLHAKRYGFIDKTGKFVIEPKFSFAESFSEGLAAVALEE